MTVIESALSFRWRFASFAKELFRFDAISILFAKVFFYPFVLMTFFAKGRKWTFISFLHFTFLQKFRKTIFAFAKGFSFSFVAMTALQKRFLLLQTFRKRNERIRKSIERSKIKQKSKILRKCENYAKKYPFSHFRLNFRIIFVSSLPSFDRIDDICFVSFASLPLLSFLSQNHPLINPARSDKSIKKFNLKSIKKEI